MKCVAVVWKSLPQAHLHADGIDGSFGLEHGKIAVDRGEREIGIVGFSWL